MMPSISSFMPFSREFVIFVHVVLLKPPLQLHSFVFFDLSLTFELIGDEEKVLIRMCSRIIHRVEVLLSTRCMRNVRTCLTSRLQRNTKVSFELLIEFDVEYAADLALNNTLLKKLLVLFVLEVLFDHLFPYRKGGKKVVTE